MNNLKLTQWQHETESWKRLLGFIMDGNVHMKNRLSEVLKENFNKGFLEEAENFQNYFLNEDKLINLLRNDVAELEKLLVREIFEDGKIQTEIERKIKHIRKNISITEIQFGKLKSEFNNYISEII